MSVTAYERISEIAQKASIDLNNMAVTLPEEPWLDVRQTCQKLELLVEQMNQARRNAQETS